MFNNFQCPSPVWKLNPSPVPVSASELAFAIDNSVVGNRQNSPFLTFFYLCPRYPWSHDRFKLFVFKKHPSRYLMSTMKEP